MPELLPVETRMVASSRWIRINTQFTRSHLLVSRLRLCHPPRIESLHLRGQTSRSPPLLHHTLFLGCQRHGPSSSDRSSSLATLDPRALARTRIPSTRGAPKSEPGRTWGGVAEFFPIGETPSIGMGIGDRANETTNGCRLDDKHVALFWTKRRAWGAKARINIPAGLSFTLVLVQLVRRVSHASLVSHDGA